VLSGPSRRFYSWVRGRRLPVVLAALVLYVLVTWPRLGAAPAGWVAPLDARLFYTPEEAFSTVASYGDAARFWILMYLTWDVVNPILYTLALGLSISWLFRRGLGPENKLRRLNVLPIGAGLFDLLENACVVTLLAVYPGRPAVVARMSTVFTTGKFGFLFASIALVVAGLIACLISSLRRWFR